MSVTHERVAVSASSILLLRADDCLQRFHAAWVISGHCARLSGCLLNPPKRTWRSCGGVRAFQGQGGVRNPANSSFGPAERGLHFNALRFRNRGRKNCLRPPKTSRHLLVRTAANTGVTDLPPWRRRELVLTQIFVRDRTDTAKRHTE